ncbi:hypothetical protein [Acinetobacter larvae]|uniref:Uncharacterized protein n=1 Tax=Acinetobacter larvae TaxID=1789224 RepID=A0A1B2LWL0_9GAMM|nr:hypothetical protein [Acinetobacter larvae]AOA57153.1 hypothetical protein BFG52_01490 [Acinetobacter larvae]
MNKKLVLSVLASLVIGGLLGYVITDKTVTRYKVIDATCSTLNVAVEQNMLQAAQIKELGKLTKQKLGDNTTAAAFKISDKMIENASEHSNCSQFMLGMSQ